MHQLGATDDGAGVPVVCLHSGGFTSRQWKRLAAALSPSYRVILPDLIGYGAPGAWAAAAPVYFPTQLPPAAGAALAAGLGQPAHLVGHSYGGFLALHVARRLPVRSVAVYE